MIRLQLKTSKREASQLTSRLRLLPLWTLKSWPCKYRCMRRFKRNTKGRRIGINSKRLARRLGFT